MDPTFALKAYQRDALEAVRRWLIEIADSGDADTAFYRATRRPYQAVADLPGVPYACLRLPTGGGKTLLAAHTVGLTADAFLKSDAPVALWLVPSNAIREQTLATLRDRTHPYRQALAERFGENVRIMDVAEALYAKRPDYDGGAVVIVATLQAFRVTETEGRKVYEANGELMDHFTGLSDAQTRLLERADGGSPIPSLCNVLKLRRPMVIVDEAHNARTALSFATLARLSPSVILELTATPAADSNVLHHVSAAELKAADMIKLPIVLRGRADWKDTVRDARAWLESLSEKARAEEAVTGEYVRPVMLLQAQPNSKVGERITVDVLKAALIEDFLVPPEQIAVATGSVWELDGVDLASRDTAVRYIITVQALREGWDCPNAYVLCSVAEQHGSTAVQQILGRIMRLPKARGKLDPDLNQAYAFSATQSFQATAAALAEGLVANGFERVEAKEMIRAAPSLPGFEDGAAIFQSEPLPESLDLEPIRATIAATTAGRVKLNLETRRLETTGALTERDATTLRLSVPAAVTEALESLVRRSAALVPAIAPVTEAGFSVPTLCIERGGRLELFGREHFLDLPWRLETCDASAVLTAFAPPAERVEEAHLDVSDAGRIGIAYVQDLHEQLALALGDREWTLPQLVRWLDRRLAPTTRPDVTQGSAQAFIRAALDVLQTRGGYSLERLARLKFRLVDALARTVNRFRDERQTSAFETCLFGNALPFRTASEHAVAFSADSYWVDGRHRYAGRHRFTKHINPDQIGEMNSEEEQCALAIELHGKVRRWVRNLERRPDSFRLATSSDWFYPDFVAELTDRRFLAVEYKGGHLASGEDTAEKELVGRKWAEASAGTCLFVMARGRDYGAIQRALQ